MIYNILDYRAIPDGKTLATDAIQAAINACPPRSRVYIPAGDYYTGPLFLQSNVTIELAEGARLVGDTDRNHYPVLPGLTYTTDETDEFNLGSCDNKLFDYINTIKSKVINAIKLIKGDVPIDGLARRLDIALSMISTKKIVPKEDKSVKKMTILIII